MLFFGYDGSIHGDWVSHYATHLAARRAQKKLHLIHIRDGNISEATIEQRLAAIRDESEWMGVELEVQIEPLHGSVFESICSVVPAGSESFLVCGTRGRDRQHGLLSGTVAARSLRSGHCNVLALRVVQPGLLGVPRRLLLPVSGHPRGFRSGLPFLKLFGPDVSHLHILFVARVGRWRFRLLSHDAAEQRRQPGEEYTRRVECEITEQLGLPPAVMSTHVVVSDDVSKEIALAATKTKSHLIYMGASERNLTERFLYGNPIEQVLRNATCDVAIYRGVD